MQKFLLFVVVLMSAATASAAEVIVHGTAYSTTDCRYYSTSKADFLITFKNAELPWSTSVVLHYGFFDQTTQQPWQRKAAVAAKAVSPYTWEARVEEIEVDARGSFAFTELELYFEIHLPNGEVTYDNAGKSMGYYRAKLPERTCTRSQVLEQLPLSTS